MAGTCASVSNASEVSRTGLAGGNEESARARDDSGLRNPLNQGSPIPLRRRVTRGLQCAYLAGVPSNASQFAGARWKAVRGRTGWTAAQPKAL